MEITILTPEKEIFRGTIRSIKVPGITGYFEVLENHAAIVSALKAGEVRIYDSNNQKVTYKISKGFIEVLHNNVSLLVQGVQ